MLYMYNIYVCVENTDTNPRTSRAAPSVHNYVYFYTNMYLTRVVLKCVIGAMGFGFSEQEGRVCNK